MHVSYNTGYSPNPGNTGLAKTRDKNGNNWETPQTVLSSPSASGAEKLQVAGSTLYDFYYLMIAGGGQFYYNLYYKTRNLDQTQWSSGTMLGQSVDIATLMNSTNTNDQNAHVIYQDDGIYHKSSANWNSSDLVSSDFLYYSSIGFSSAGNDLFATWKPMSSNYISYRQYDAVPLTPPDFAGTNYDNHPKLTWTKREADIQYFEIYWQIVNDPKDPGSWNLLTTTSNTSFVDYGVQLGGSESGEVNYKIRSKDYGNNLSPYTGIITFGYSGLNKTVARNDLNEYKLFGNYPNPFNPSTKISYSIKEEGLVTLKVYDILGKEVATLVNENKPEGFYDAEFDASQLPSGMYIYKLQAGQFSDVMKMILTK